MKMIHKGWLHGSPLSDDIKQLFADASEWGATLGDAGQAAIGQLLMFAETEHRRANLSQQLHDLEIPGGIEWTFDGAWRAWIGNPRRDEANVGSEAEALEWLRKMAGEIYGVTGKMTDNLPKAGDTVDKTAYRPSSGPTIREAMIAEVAARIARREPGVHYVGASPDHVAVATDYVEAVLSFILPPQQD